MQGNILVLRTLGWLSDTAFALPLRLFFGVFDFRLFYVEKKGWFGLGLEDVLRRPLGLSALYQLLGKKQRAVLSWQSILFFPFFYALLCNYCKM